VRGSLIKTGGATGESRVGGYEIDGRRAGTCREGMSGGWDEETDKRRGAMTAVR